MLTKSKLLVLGVALIGVGCGLARGEVVAIPNGDFKLQDASSLPYANQNIDSWKKAPKPAFFPGTDNQWDQAAGVFYNLPDDPNDGIPSSFITNLASTQAAFLYASPLVELYQELRSTWEVGKSYSLAFGLISSTSETPFVGPVAIGTTIDAVLYYRDGSDNRVDVARKSVANTAEIGNRTFMTGFVLDVPVVQTGDAWAGKAIGIQFISTADFTNSGGVWDVGNLELTAELAPPSGVPEPTSLAMMGVGIAALLFRRRA